MRILEFALCCVFAAVLSAPSRAADRPGVIPPFDGLPKIELLFDIDGGSGNWSQQSKTADQAVFSCDGHKLKLWLSRSGSQKLLKFKLNAPAGKSLLVHGYTAKLTTPSAGLHAVMCPSTRKIAQDRIYYKSPQTWQSIPPMYQCLVTEKFIEAALANSEGPFVLLTDPKGNNALSAGWTKANWETWLSGEAEGSDYAITLARHNDVPFTGSNLEDTLIVSTATELWYDNARAYAIAFDRLNGRAKKKPVADWATDPYWDSWYCYGDHINEDQILKVARKCKEIGIRTVLIDAGWDVSPDNGYIDFEGALGDHVALKDQFPDLPGAVRKMHAMGLKVELWCAPFWEGKQSNAYRTLTSSWHMQTSKGEHHCLCPRYPKLAHYLRDRFAWIMRTYGVDGIWIDAADNIPRACTAKHEHIDKPMGEAFLDCMLAVREGMRSVKPDAVLEVRPIHGNLNSKPAFDIIQPSDATEKLDTQRLATTQLRAWCYDTVVKSDPMKWSKEADAATVGKFMATTLCMGVPALSVDFVNATDEHSKIAKAWFSFFRRHKNTLVHGEFRPVGAAYYNPDLMLVGKDEAIIYIRNPNTKDLRITRPVKRVIVFNCLEQDSLSLSLSTCSGRFAAQSYAPDWMPSGRATQADAAGTLHISQDVPMGGALVIGKK